MSAEINILMGYCPFIGVELAKKLKKENAIDTCVLASWKREYVIKEEYITYYFDEDQRYARYNEYIDLDKLPPLSQQLLEDLLPYESMSIKLGLRGCNFPIVEYEEEKRNYHKHVRFWNWVFETHKINFVYFDEFPHNLASEYVIYALAKVKKIPVLMLDYPSGLGIRVPGTDFNDFGETIKKYYFNMQPNQKIDKNDIDGIIGEFYQNKKRKYLNEDKEYLDSKYIRKQLKYTANLYFGAYIGWKTPLRYFRNKLYKLCSIDKTKKDKYQLNEVFFKRVSLYKKYYGMNYKQYNKIAELPNYNEKYIFFGLQMTPEATTIPLAGVFSEQYTSIQLVAKIAENNGLKVYVKEHFVQYHRDKNVYEMIRSIPNVRLIKSNVDSAKLIKNSIAVATQTGTLILEGAILGKPALVVGQGYAWKGIPNVIEIRDEEQGTEAFRDFCASYKYSEEELLRYLYSIKMTCFDDPVQKEWKIQYDEQTHTNEDKRVQLIQRYINRYIE